MLSCNLEHPIAKFFGEMKGMMGTKEFWDKQFAENMVVVCTAQILLDCLHNGFISMAQINLLVFDEAHHTKKNHPYARIIKSHYIRLEKEKRPRIMGMTASPVDCQTTEIKNAAAQLENMLCSEIATVSDEVMAQTYNYKQTVIETRENYARLEFPENSVTELWCRIYERVGSNPQFRPAIEFTKEASSTLGRWCADRCWKLLITDNELTRLSARTDRDFADDFAANADQGEQATESIRSVQADIKAHDPGAIEPRSSQLSSKVKCLYEILEEAFTQLGTRRCIVFVEKRFTACILADLFQQDGIAIRGMTVAHVVCSVH